jgi:hypothetical protein
MKCKCGAQTRITVSGESYCWECYDDSLRQHDGITAASVAEAYKKYFMGGTCGFCNQTPCHPVCDDESLCDEAAYQLIFSGGQES